MSSRSKKLRSRRWECVEVPAIDELEMLTDEQIEKQSLPSGFCVRFFRHDMRHLFTVASIYVKMTRGVLDYLHDYNQLGPNKSRNKLFLCSQYNAEGKCLNGAYCREIHCTLPAEAAEEASLYGVPSNATGAPNVIRLVDKKEILEKGLNKPIQGAGGPGTPHPEGALTATATDILHDDAGKTDSVFDSILAEASEDSATAGPATVTPLNAFVDDRESDSPVPPQTVISMPENTILRHSLHSRWTSRAMYATLPAGVLFHVALPNTPTPVDEFDSAELFVTRGAQEYYDQRVRNEPSSVTMQHCAHYSKNGVCCFGTDCQFVHVMHYRIKEREGADGCSSEFDATVTSGSGYAERRGGGGGSKSRRAKENPLCVQVPSIPAGSAAGRGSCKKESSGAASRSSSNNRSANSSTARSPSNLANSSNTPNASCVFVPSSQQWMPPPPQQQQQQQILMQSSGGSSAAPPAHQPPPPPPPPFDPSSTQKPILYQNTTRPSTSGLFPQPPQAGLQPQPPDVQGQGQGPFAFVRGPNGELFVVPTMGASAGAQPQQVNVASLPSVYMNMLPMQFN